MQSSWSEEKAGHDFVFVFMRLAQQFQYVQHVVRKRACHNFPRVQTTYSKLQVAIETIYKAGEGWTEQDVDKILKAIVFAANKHERQIRKDKAQTSYLVHLLSVAYHLLTLGRVRDSDVIAASLLHDTLEDTKTSYEELVKEFGGRIADFVLEVTDDQNLLKEERKKLQITTASYKSSGAAQIKLADKWDNLMDLLHYPPPSWSKKRVEAYFVWAKHVCEALPWVNAPLLGAVESVISEFYTHGIKR